MTDLTKKILESSTKELRTLKEQHEGTLAAVVIDQEMRLRDHTDSLGKLNRDYINRKEL